MNRGLEDFATGHRSRSGPVWLLARTGRRAPDDSLGIEHFGQSGTISDLSAHLAIDFVGSSGPSKD